MSESEEEGEEYEESSPEVPREEEDMLEISSDQPGTGEDTHDVKQQSKKDTLGASEMFLAAKAKREKLALSAMEARNRKGVVYMSRIPPHLKPLKLRHILSQYGEVGRLYLAPEDSSLRKRRKRLQGNSGKMFSEGWIEFSDKSVAKRVAEMLNGHPMGGKKRSAYHYDLWCLKYLPKFKWDHLTEEIAYQNAVREQKLANEISAAKRERDFYLSQVDRARAEEAQEQRRKRKAEIAGEDEGPLRSDIKSKVKRSFGQKTAISDDVNDVNAKVLPQSVLALVAGKTDR